MDRPDYSPWIGRVQEEAAPADAWPVTALEAALDRVVDAAPGSAFAPLAHWCFFAPTVPQSQLGPDGHPRRGGFLPPVALPRRMWAASDVTFRAPVRAGMALRRRSAIAEISEKAGATGPLVFVKVRHDYLGPDGTELLSELQTLVYREMPAPDEPAPAPRPAPEGAEWSRPATPDETLLFRFSAVTFNAHRIHYDQPYTTTVEGYPGLVVQGQLLATLMLRAMPERALAAFSFRAVQPVFAGETVFAEGKTAADGGVELWIRGTDGALRMQGRARPA